jgi:hypothetical protein
MESFSIRLEACDPARGHFRAYRIEAGTDLFGSWLVDATYGRIGSRGRTIRRNTAPKRIGITYQLTDLADPGQWITTPSPSPARYTSAAFSLTAAIARSYPST